MGSPVFLPLRERTRKLEDPRNLGKHTFLRNLPLMHSSAVGGGQKLTSIKKINVANFISKVFLCWTII